MLCTLEKTIYEDRDSGFSIASFKTKDEAVPSAARSTYYHGDKLIRFTAIGYHLPITSVIEVDMNGTWENGKYGMQLKVEACTEIIPKTKDGIIAYLSSGLIKGIGEKRRKLSSPLSGWIRWKSWSMNPNVCLRLKASPKRNWRQSRNLSEKAVRFGRLFPTLRHTV